jgi:hypothetical protein
MTNVINPAEEHAFVGVWVTEDEDSDVSFDISLSGDSFHVVGVCISDGEEFEIQNLVSGNNTLSFDAVMPSTGWRSKNVFRLRNDGKADLELTIYEVWKKREHVSAG